MTAACLLMLAIPLSLAGEPLAVARGCSDSCDAAGCIFRAIYNLPLGDARLRIDGDCNLVVERIGGSGRDGVVQTQLESFYMASELEAPNFSRSIAGTMATIRQVGIVDGEAGQEISVAKLLNFNGRDVRATFSCAAIGVTGYAIHIYDGVDLVQERRLGVSPPVLIYPREDIEWMACGIWPNGDVYTALKLGAPQPVLLRTPLGDAGPYSGDLVFVSALSPSRIPTLQSDIENVFFATGPLTMTSQFAGSLPGAGPPCRGSCAAELEGGLWSLERFVREGLRALMGCARSGVPLCPAPCSGFPSLADSGLAPSCYDLAGCHLDAVALSAFGEAWGDDRCALGPADACGLARGSAAGKLMERILVQARNGKADTAAEGVSRCRREVQARGGPACPTDICDQVPGWVEAILGSP